MDGERPLKFSYQILIPVEKLELYPYLNPKDIKVRGLKMESYKNLTDEEGSKPYAKYFDRAPAIPLKEALAVMAQPIDPSMALTPENLNDLLNPGYLASEAGWCILPNGAGYVSNLSYLLKVNLFLSRSCEV